MRVLVVHNRYREPGGEDSVVRAEADLLMEGGHEVRVFEVQNPPSDGQAAAALGRSIWNSKAAAAVESVASDFKPDVVHVHNTWYSLSPAPLWALRHLDAARVVTLHNYRLVCVNAHLYRDGHRCTDCLGHLPWRGVGRRCYRGSLGASLAVAASSTAHRLLGTWEAQAEVLVVPTAFARDILVLGGIPADSIAVKPHFVSDPGPRARPPSNSPTVLFAGRFTPEKGLVPVTAAWQADPPSGLEFLLVGDGELRQQMEHLGPSIRVIGWQSRTELSELMRQARAVVAPSQWFETFGLTAAEAMAAGCPVLTVAGGAIAEVVGESGPAPVQTPSSTDEWQERFAQLTDPVSVDRWGAAARLRYEELYHPRQGLDALLGIYKQAIERRRSGPSRERGVRGLRARA